MEYQKIFTNKGIIKFKPKHFDLNMKPLNKNIAKENLFILKKILDENNIPFVLIYGTLLGAIREKNFISHDQDIDIAILDEFREKLLDTLHELINYGFEIGRYERDLLTILRKGEYIDIYIFKKYLFGKRKFNDEILNEEYLLNTVKYNFLGKDFLIPKDYIKFLEEHYGLTWNIPIKGYHAYNPIFFKKIKNYFIKKFPYLIKVKNIFRKKNR